MSEYTIDIFEAARLIKKRIYFPVLILIIFMAVSIVRSFRTPLIYTAEATISIPEAEAFYILKKIDNNTNEIQASYLVNVAETREIVKGLADNQYRALLEFLPDTTIVKDLIGIRIDGIFGSDKYFRTIIKTKNQSEAALTIAYGLIEYLDQKALSLKQTPHMANDGYGPEKDGKKNPTNDPMGQITNIIPKYKFIREPVITNTPSKKKPIAELLVMAFTGFMLGCALLLFYGVLDSGKKTAPYEI